MDGTKSRASITNLKQQNDDAESYNCPLTLIFNKQRKERCRNKRDIDSYKEYIEESKRFNANIVSSNFDANSDETQNADISEQESQDEEEWTDSDSLESDDADAVNVRVFNDELTPPICHEQSVSHRAGSNFRLYIQ